MVTAAAAIPPVTPVVLAAMDSLSVPLAADDVAPLWPLELVVAIVPHGDGDVTAPVPEQAMVVLDGHPVQLAGSATTPRGRHDFTVTVVARQHPDEAIELEWDLEVDHAPYDFPPGWDGWGRYLLHRLDWVALPTQSIPSVAVVRSDIVSTRNAPLREVLEIDGQAYEFRIFARRLRG